MESSNDPFNDSELARIAILTSKVSNGLMSLDALSVEDRHRMKIYLRRYCGVTGSLGISAIRGVR